MSVWSSARIGDPAHMMSRGIVSYYNAPARAAGVVPGMECRHAAESLLAAPLVEAAPEPFGETRSVLELPGAARRVVLVDSAAQVEPGDAGHIIVTGSHGGLVGGASLSAAEFLEIFRAAA